MTRNNFITFSFKTEQPNAGSYVAVTGIALLASVLTTTNAQARNIALTEVVVYEGAPIDYSNRDDVIVIEDPSLQYDYSAVAVFQNNPTDSSSQPKQVAKRATPKAQPQALKRTQVAQRAKIQSKKQVRIRPIQAKPAPVTLQNIASNTHKNTNLPTKVSLPNVDGKDPHLVAFYIAVFKKQRYYNAPTQSKPPITLAVKQTPTKKVVQKKAKPRKVQLAKTTIKGKDPELVAFYKLVFSNGKYTAKKQIPSVVRTAAGKDPELVAFYEQVFGKSANRTQVPAVTKNDSTKMNFADSSKSNQKRSVKNAKGKTKNSISIASVDLQRLIDDLTSKKIL